MGAVDQLTGIVPTVVAGGVALKFTDAALGRKKRVSYPRSKKGRKLSKKHSPF